MHKYRKTKVEYVEEQFENEVLVLSEKTIRWHLDYTNSLFSEKKYSIVTLRGRGNVIHKCVALALILHKRVKGLSQIVEFWDTKCRKTYEPLEEGLDTVYLKQKIPCIIIKMSLKPLDTNHPGYHEPLPEEEIICYSPIRGDFIGRRSRFGSRHGLYCRRTSGRGRFRGRASQEYREYVGDDRFSDNSDGAIEENENSQEEDSENEGSSDSQDSWASCEKASETSYFGTKVQDRISTAHPLAMTTSDSAFWVWDNGLGFDLFSPTNTRIIESAYLSRNNKCIISENGNKYVIDLVSMFQINENTKFKRKVMRVHSENSPDPPKPKVIWKWNDGLEYVNYLKDANKILENEYQAHNPTCMLSISGKSYKIDFIKMEQQNLSTNYIRNIKRSICLTIY